MEYRVEKKFLISDRQIHILTAKLKTVMQSDSNQQGTAYLIRSLYFDDIFDSCMQENESGVDQRSKFRLRLYQPSAEKIFLENKEKFLGYTKKTRNIVTRQECLQLVSGKPLAFDQRTVSNSLAIAMKTRHMMPKIIIEYQRTAFIHPLGNVRITFDKDISASTGTLDMFSNEYHTTKVLPEDILVLEVKYDDYIPSHILSLLQTAKADRCAVSKYIMCRDRKRMVKFT